MTSGDANLAVKLAVRGLLALLQKGRTYGGRLKI
jgi:hypothetical protein